MTMMKAVVTRHWKLGVFAFLLVLGLCVIAIGRRPVRYNVVFTFAVQTIDREIDLPGAGAINPENIQNLLNLSLEERSLHGSVFHQGGTFTVLVHAIAENATDQVQHQLSATHQRLVEQLAKDVDPAPLAARVNSLDTQVDLIRQTLESTALSPYERYALQREALILRTERNEARSQLDVVSTGIFDAPTSQLFRAEQIDDDVLLLLGLILSAFVACAAVILADSFSRSE